MPFPKKPTDTEVLDECLKKWKGSIEFSIREFGYYNHDAGVFRATLIDCITDVEKLRAGEHEIQED